MRGILHNGGVRRAASGITLLLGLNLCGDAQTPPSTPQAASEPSKSQDPLHRESPRSSVDAFLEVANVPVAAAVANAVADACGVRITDLPITSEKVYQALKARYA